MTIRFACAACGSPCSAPDSKAGVQTRCPKCGQTIQIPLPAAPPILQPVIETGIQPPPKIPILQVLPATPADVPGTADPAELSRVQETARKRLLGPAIGILVSGILSVSLGLMAFAVDSLEKIQGPREPSALEKLDLNSAENGRLAAKGTRSCVELVGLLGGVLTIAGAVQMFTLKNHRMATTACIVSMIPFLNCCFLIGAPFGIWGLIVLNQPEVKAAFR